VKKEVALLKDVGSLDDEKSKARESLSGIAEL